MLSDLTRDLGICAVAKYRKAVSTPLNTDAAIGYALTHLMYAAKDGFACAVLLDKKRRHLCTVSLKRHGKMAEETVLELIERAVDEYCASFLVIAHNHRDDVLRPSGADLITTELVRKRFFGDKVTFLDHFIISGNRWDTVMNKKYRENYVKPKDLI